MTATISDPTPSDSPTLALPSAAPPPPIERPRVLLVGASLASAATFMFFMGLIGIYLDMRAATPGGVHAWIPVGTKIPLVQPNMMLATLLLSSFTIQWVVTAIKHDDRGHAYVAMGISLVLAFAFINQTYYLLTLVNLDISANVLSVLIYTITGAVIAMVIAGMVFLILMGFRAMAGQFTSRQHDGISAAAIYWHSMVAIYAVVWFAIFVTK